MKSVEMEAASVDAAVDRALSALEVSRSQVEVQVLATASRGLFGIGSRMARVRVTVATPVTEPPAAMPPPVGSGADAHDSDGGRPERSRVDARARTSPGDDGSERAAQVLREIVQRIGVAADVSVRSEGDHVVLDLSGDTSGVLIGRRGQMLDALEYIVNRIVARDDEAATRFVVDSQHYRARRQAGLEELARRMAEQAKAMVRAVTLNPMSPRDRRTVHLVLRDDAALTTKSVGKGYFRRLVIIPQGATPPRRDER